MASDRTTDKSEYKTTERYVHAAVARMEMRDVSRELRHLPDIVELPAGLARNIRSLAGDIERETDRKEGISFTAPILISLFWRPDGYGRPGRALYAGDLYIGEVGRAPTCPRDHDCPWLAWLMTTDEGRDVGCWATEQEAKDALVDAALKALQP